MGHQTQQLSDAWPERRYDSDVCVEPGCATARRSRGYCAKHYRLLHRAGALPPLACPNCGAPKPHPLSKWCEDCRPQCMETECGERARTRGYCYRHYNIHFRSGAFGAQPCALRETCQKPGVYPDGLCQQHYQRRKIYDLTLEELATIDAGCACDICGDPAGYVDHCHATNETRGFLCLMCNNGLGNFRDRLDLLDRAKAYLTNPPLRRRAA